MRSEKEIKDRIAILQSDTRYDVETAGVAAPDPIAIAQVDLKVTVASLMWVVAGSAREGVNASVVDGMLQNYRNVIVSVRDGGVDDGVIEYRGLMFKGSIKPQGPNCGMPSHHQPCDCEGAGGDR